MAKKDKKQKPKKPEPKQKEKPVSRRKKGARKKFFSVDLPLTSTNVKLYSYSQEDLIGSIVKLDLTKNMRGKNLEFRSKINLKNEKLYGDLISLKLMQSYIKRVIRRGSDYIEDSFISNSKDSKIRIKPLMITRKKVSRSVRKEIRNRAKKYLEGHIAIRNTNELFSEIMTNKLQKELSQKVKKVYPLSFCEIRWIEVLGPAEKIDPKNKQTPILSEEKSSELKTPIHSIKE